VAYVAAILLRAFRDAIRWQALIRNPTDAADPPRPSARKEMQTWSGAQVRAFLDSVDHNRLRGCWWLLANTGMRRGEVLGLRWEDVDVDAGTLHIVRTLITTDVQRKGSPGMAWGTPKTAKGRRTVALDPATVTALRVHRTRQLEERFQEYAQGWPWSGRSEQLERWVAEGGWAHSTVRGYQGAVGAFCGCVIDPRYGWVAECEQRVGARPTQICHEDNMAVDVADYEGRPERRPLSRLECQALFDAADDRAQRLAVSGRKGWLTAFRDATLLKGDLRLGVALSGGDDAGPDRLHREPGSRAARRVGGVSRPVRQGDARFSAAPAGGGQRDAVGGRGLGGVPGAGTATVRGRGTWGVVADRAGWPDLDSFGR